MIRVNILSQYTLQPICYLIRWYLDKFTLKSKKINKNKCNYKLLLAWSYYFVKCIYIYQIYKGIKWLSLNRGFKWGGLGFIINGDFIICSFKMIRNQRRLNEYKIKWKIPLVRHRSRYCAVVNPPECGRIRPLLRISCMLPRCMRTASTCQPSWSTIL